MKKGDICEAVVEKIDFPNKGILHVDGERVIVKNAVPGQKVRFVITHRLSSRIGPVPMAASAAAACIRGFPMRSS